ncbi:MAG: glutathione peroxidase [Mycobacteriales bacterium]
MSLYEIPVRRLDGSPASLLEHAGKAVLVVNVASRCGKTPQYAGLERLQRTYADRGFTVVGVPSNQFKGQEPGTADEIAQFCAQTYGVSFPLLEKTDVNGDDRHPLFEELTKAPYADGRPGGDVTWNFEKFLVSPEGRVVGRWSHDVEPDDASLVAAIEARLPAA